MERIGIALVGAGRMGRIHGASAAGNPGLHLKYVVDPRPDAAGVADDLGAERADLDTMLADASVRGVLVCSTTDRHLEHALAAIDAGKAVFCEKPIDLDLAKVRQAQSRFDGACFQLGFNRRFDPHFRALQRKLHRNEAGALETLHIVNHDPAAPPPGFVPTSGGLFKDFTIHDLDMARWLLGEEPVEVFAAASCLVDAEIGRLGDVDTARVVLKTASGRLCTISNTRRSGCGYDQRIEACCAGGMLAVGNLQGDTVHVLGQDGAHAAPILAGFAQRYREAYRAQIDHFADVLHGHAQPAIGYADGMAALILAEACEQSLRQGTTLRLQESTA